MALLILFFLFFLPHPLLAVTENIKDTAILYDAGEPEASVGIYGDDFLEVGTLYENYRVIGFEPNAIIVRDQTVGEQEKWVKNGRLDSKIRQQAKYLFVSKQMRLIYQAQMNYVEKFKDHYAISLNELIDQGFLNDGFRKGEKQGYRFKIEKTGDTKRMAPHFVREPIFLATAEPLNPEKDHYYFSVDQLGLVRYADTKRQITWGPVWDYNEVNAKVPTRVIVHDDEDADS